MKENKFGLLMPLAAGLVLASSANPTAALGMGAAVIIVLLLTSLVMYGLKKVLPSQGLLPAYLLVATGFAGLTQMLMQAHFPTAANLLGAHLATMAIAALPFCQASQAGGRDSLGKTLAAASVAGVKFFVLMILCAVIREVLGKGSFFGLEIAFLADYRISTLAGAFGGYLVLACVMAACSAVANRSANRKKEEANV